MKTITDNEAREMVEQGVAEMERVGQTMQILLDKYGYKTEFAVFIATHKPPEDRETDALGTAVGTVDMMRNTLAKLMEASLENFEREEDEKEH